MALLSIHGTTLCEREGEADGYVLRFRLGRFVVEWTVAWFPA